MSELRGPSDEAIAEAHAIYTPRALSFYDVVVHGLSNRFAWKCPASKIAALYAHHLTDNHLEAAAGTGLFLDRVGTRFDRLTLVDINQSCLDVSARRLQRFSPVCQRANLLAPMSLDVPPAQSVGLTYALHCLPGTMPDKLLALDYLQPFMANGSVLFGATILGKGVRPNLPARALLRLYNEKGVFNNLDDDLNALADGLDHRFSHVDIVQHGLVALFSARS
ncbi:MAG: methyltransferase type 12 [Pseudomonadota bacterium]